MTILVLMIGISACSDSSLVSHLQKPGQAISKAGSQTVMKIKAADLYHSQKLTHWLNNVGIKDGSAILHALKEKSASLQGFQVASVAIKNLKAYARPVVTGSRAGSSSSGGGTTGLASVSSRLQIQNDNGQVENFVLTLQPYNPDPSRLSSRQVVAGMAAGKANTGSGTGDTYLALDPDFFYVHDIAGGQENWPVTFPAVSLTDSTQKIMVTFDKTGFVSSSFAAQPGGGGAASSTSGENEPQPNLVFVTPVPIIQPNVVHPCEEGSGDCPPGGGNTFPPGPGGGGSGGGSGSGPGPLCTKVYGRGGNAGLSDDPNFPYPQYETFFAVTAIRLYETGDGDGQSELQMFVEQNNDYTNCFPQKYKFRFDRVIRFTPVSNAGPFHTPQYHGVSLTAPIPTRNHIIQGADNFTGLAPYYKVPDVNLAGHTYSFTNITAWVIQFQGLPTGPGGYYKEVTADFFPLFNLTTQAGPWRLVLSDDDKDYEHYSTNHVSSIHGTQLKNIDTYNMDTGTWSNVSTGFTANPFDNGSSDDPIQGSGVRMVTKENVQSRPNNNGVVTVQKNYSNGNSMYKFKLITEDASYYEVSP